MKKVITRGKEYRVRMCITCKRETQRRYQRRHRASGGETPGIPHTRPD